jgi:hypothetical protein
MSPPYWSDRDPDTREQLKDPPLRVAIVGYVLPGIILAVVATNVLLGKVYVPAGGRGGGDVLDGLLQSYSPDWQFAGLIAFKLGLAVALHAWFALANHERTERYAILAMLGGCITAGMGVLAFGAGFFL